MVERFVWNSRNGNLQHSHGTLVFNCFNKTVKKILCVTSLSLKTSLFMTDLFQNNVTETATKLLPIIRVCMQTTFEPEHDKPNKIICAPSEDSDQPGHPPSLTRVFAVRSMSGQGPKMSSCGQWKLWSDMADTQADLSLRWAHTSFCLFCCAVTHLFVFTCDVITGITNWKTNCSIGKWAHYSG